MKYLVKAEEEQIWTVWYIVEADSGDEAEAIVREGDWNKAYEVDDEYLETTSRDILEIEPSIE